MSDTPKHTPGPWKAEPQPDRRGFDTDEWVIGPDPMAREVARVDPVMSYFGTAENRANAHLIAAAPDLLGACRNMLEAYQLIPVPECVTEQERMEYQGLEAARKTLQSAISKATGI